MNLSGARLLLARVGFLVMLASVAPALGQQAAQVHGSGSFTIKYEGILLPRERKPNESGPVAFKAIDLDEGKGLPRTMPELDFSLALEALTAIFSVDTPPDRQGVDAGNAAPGFQSCKDLVAGTHPPKLLPSKTPTHFFCVRTSEGRIASFRIVSWEADYKASSNIPPDNFVDVTVTIERVVWDLPK